MRAYGMVRRLASLRRVLAVAGLLLIAATALAVPVARLSHSGAADASTIRARFIANSDSDFDQSVKLSVRDAVLKALGSEWQESASPQATAAEIRAELPRIVAIARATLHAHGAEYGVQATYGEAWFPKETLGPVSVASGRYPSLVVRLGSGAGHNWWGVLFPPLAMLKLPWAGLPVVKNGIDAAGLDVSSLSPATLDALRGALAKGSTTKSPAVHAFRLEDDTILIISGSDLSKTAPQTSGGADSSRPQLRWYFADLVKSATESLASHWQNWVATAQSPR